MMVLPRQLSFRYVLSKDGMSVLVFPSMMMGGGDRFFEIFRIACWVRSSRSSTSHRLHQDWVPSAGHTSLIQSDVSLLLFDFSHRGFGREESQLTEKAILSIFSTFARGKRIIGITFCYAVAVEKIDSSSHNFEWPVPSEEAINRGITSLYPPIPSYLSNKQQLL